MDRLPSSTRPERYGRARGGRPASFVDAGGCFSSVYRCAQGNAGRILGTITDQSGGAIARAIVTITDLQEAFREA